MFSLKPLFRILLEDSSNKFLKVFRNVTILWILNFVGNLKLNNVLQSSRGPPDFECWMVTILDATQRLEYQSPISQPSRRIFSQSKVLETSTKASRRKCFLIRLSYIQPIRNHTVLQFPFLNKKITCTKTIFYGLMSLWRIFFSWM